MGERQKDMKQIQAPPTRPGPMLMAIGPGLVVSGAVIGSGELINVPLRAATFGFKLFWAVVISCIIKYFLQIEIGRHCLVRNCTTVQALTGCPGPKFRGVGWVGILFMVGYTVSVARDDPRRKTGHPGPIHQWISQYASDHVRNLLDGVSH